MAYKINPDECIGCGVCTGVCPVEAISQDDKTSKYVIDPQKCTDCGACPDTCPTGAISAN